MSQKLFSRRRIVLLGVGLLVILSGLMVPSILEFQNQRVSFQAATDSAALAVAADERANLAGLSADEQKARIDELKAFARKYMAENYLAGGATQLENMSLDLTVDGKNVALKTSAIVPWAFVAGLVNWPTELKAETKIVLPY